MTRELVVVGPAFGRLSVHEVSGDPSTPGRLVGYAQRTRAGWAVHLSDDNPFGAVVPTVDEARSLLLSVLRDGREPRSPGARWASSTRMP
jgi:hypothetical protein